MRYIDDRIKAMLTNKHSTQGYPKTAQGNPCVLQDPSITPIGEITVYGNSVQDGTPTPENPIEIQSVGDLVTDENDENYGKYCLPVKINEKVVNIYLDEPLRKIANYSDHIDWKRGVVKRYIFAHNIKNTIKWTEWNDRNGYRMIFYATQKATTGNTLGLFTLGGVNQSIFSVSTQELQRSNKIYALNGNTTIYWYPDYTLMGLDGTEDKTTADKKLQEWLATIPIKQFEYVLATPVETPIDLPDLPIIPHLTNIISTESNVKGDIKVNYHSFNREEQNV